MRVESYRNLSGGRLNFSIRHDGRVIAHAFAVRLTDVTMKHATSKQQAVCQTRRRISQWVRGDWQIDGETETAGMRRLHACPKRHDGFRDAETGDRVDHASIVILTASGAYYRA